ncbi:putative L-ascorbic acid binding protein [Rosellinia necatrix]|uniref:Putative L-ascorbic acid binding protein n=1 Tax=Rosellinia necatrix TaxID=77044 RepID=A0A1W2TP85_ROSNE|nr:putative L-ascorbic acid binding protein [Rosellinia necatrix]
MATYNQPSRTSARKNPASEEGTGRGTGRGMSRGKGKAMGNRNTASGKRLPHERKDHQPDPDVAATRWPPFKPALPVTRLAFDAPIPTLGDQIVLLRNFWPKSLCREYVAFLAGLPLTTTPGRPRRGEAARVNDRFQTSDARFAQRLWLQTGLKDAVLDDAVEHLWGGEVVGLNPNVRVYRYSKNQFFDCHYDDYNLVDVPSDDGSESIRARTTWTALLYLTSAADGVLGGETVFYPNDRKSPQEELVVAPESGMLLLHRHGDNCLLHEGREVLAGQKWIIRTDICVRR